MRSFSPPLLLFATHPLPSHPSTRPFLPSHRMNEKRAPKFCSGRINKTTSPPENQPSFLSRLSAYLFHLSSAPYSTHIFFLKRTNQQICRYIHICCRCVSLSSCATYICTTKPTQAPPSCLVHTNITTALFFMCSFFCSGCTVCAPPTREQNQDKKRGPPALYESVRYHASCTISMYPCDIPPTPPLLSPVSLKTPQPPPRPLPYVTTRKYFKTRKIFNTISNRAPSPPPSAKAVGPTTRPDKYCGLRQENYLFADIGKTQQSNQSFVPPRRPHPDP